jgi:nucleotide-binding universal stress UspA family protein
MQRLTSILVDVDARAAVQPALEHAAQLARATGASLRIVDVLNQPQELGWRSRVPLEQDPAGLRRRALNDLALTVRDVTCTVDLLAGPPAETLIQDVHRFNHDLVVRSHARDIVSGTHAVEGHLLRHCPCSVLVVGPGVESPHLKIVACLDGKGAGGPTHRATRDVLEFSFLFREIQGGTVTILRTWDAFYARLVESHSTKHEMAGYLEATRLSAQREVDRLMESSDIHGAADRIELRRGSVEDVVPEFAAAEGTHLVVMGPAEDAGVIGRLPCSLLVVRGRKQQGESARVL